MAHDRWHDTSSGRAGHVDVSDIPMRHGFLYLVAIQDFDQAIRLDPNYAPAFNAKA